MPYYEYDVEVTGAREGVVNAKNKKEALEHVEDYLCFDDLQAVSEINIRRVKKPDWWPDE